MYGGSCGLSDVLRPNVSAVSVACVSCHTGETGPLIVVQMVTAPIQTSRKVMLCGLVKQAWKQAVMAAEGRWTRLQEAMLLSTCEA